MFTVLLSTIGSGATHGMLGIVLGIGAIGRVGGTLIAVGHTIGTGITAMHGIITTTGALSVRDVTFTTAIMSCAVV
jgi:hypothetical protein